MFQSFISWLGLEAWLLSVLKPLTQQVNQIMTVLADLQAKVAANTTVVQSAVTLIQGLKAQLDAAIASGDPAQLQALSDQLGTDDAALAAAITANTPAAPAAPAAPTP